MTTIIPPRAEILLQFEKNHKCISVSAGILRQSSVKRLAGRRFSVWRGTTAKLYTRVSRHHGGTIERNPFKHIEYHSTIVLRDLRMALNLDLIMPIRVSFSYVSIFAVRQAYWKAICRSESSENFQIRTSFKIL